jgi:hypothetical protein
VVVSWGTRVLGSTGDFTGKLLESLALGLGDEESGEETEQHEEGKDLHDVGNEGETSLGVGSLGASIWGTSVLEGSKDDLGDDGTKLSGGS